jgi:hypothetical protein
VAKAIAVIICHRAIGRCEGKTMSTDPMGDQFAFIQDDTPRLRARPTSRQSSYLRRFFIASLFILFDLAILACMLHLLRIVAIPGLPRMQEDTAVNATNPPPAGAAAQSGTQESTPVTKLIRAREIARASGSNMVRPGQDDSRESAADAEFSPEETLENEGLKKVGARYVFSDEEDLQKRLDKARALFKQAKEAFEHLKRAAYDFNVLNNAVQTNDVERTELEAAIAGQQEFVNRLPRVTNVERAAYDEANGSLSLLRARLTEVRRQLDHGRRELIGVTRQKNQAVQTYKSKQSEFLMEARRLESAFDKRIEDYRSLTNDPKIKKSLEAVGRAGGKSLQLSPSKDLSSSREELKKAVKIVESAEVPAQ